MDAAGNKLIFNAKIYSPDGHDNTWMVINSETGYVVQTGRGDPPLSDFGENCKIDIQGKRILPGFHESHIHASSIGLAQDGVQMHGCSSIDEFKKRIATYCQEHPGKEWIRGRGWDHVALGRWPDKRDVDAICSDRPLFISRNCGHISIINSKAMDIIGFDASTPDPPGGEFDRFPEGHPLAGQLTGVIRETVRDEVLKHCAPTSLEKREYIEVAISKLLESGVTTAHSLESETWNEYCELAEEGRLPVRIFYSAYFTSKDSGNFPHFAGESRSDFLSCDRIKLFADGSLGGYTAAMSIPYKNTSNKGIFVYTQDKMDSLIHEATSLGYRLEVHVIGDAAAEMTLNAIEKAQVSPEKRPILTHCQFLREDLIERMRKQGCVANIQPQFVPTDAALADAVIPEELLRWSYPWKTLLDKGVHCAGGSDAPVETPTPLIAIYDAIFRPHGKREIPQCKQFRPEECLSVRQAVDLYTIDGAYATLQEHRLGKLVPGYQADFIVIDSDDDVIDHPELFLTAKVAETWVAGVKRYTRPSQE